MFLVLTQCFPPTVGGIEGLMGGLARTLFSAGHEVTVLADAVHGDAAHDAEVPYAARRFGGWKPLRRRLKARAARALLPRAEAVYADSWKSLEHLKAAPGAPVLCFAHGNEFPEDVSPSRVARVRAALGVATVLLANSADTAARAVPFLPEGLPVRLTPPPVDQPPEPTPEETAAVAALWPAGSGPRLLTLCRLEPLKGVDRVIAALPALRSAHPGVALVVAGDGADRSRLTALAASAGVADRVRFVGWVRGGVTTALFRSADLLAMPTRAVGSRREGYGLAFVEAGLAGTPSLAGRVGGAGDAVIDGETGRLVDGADQGAVTAALRDLLAEPDRLAAMGHAARLRAQGQLWPTRIGDFLPGAA